MRVFVFVCKNNKEIEAMYLREQDKAHGKGYRKEREGEN